MFVNVTFVWALSSDEERVDLYEVCLGYLAFTDDVVLLASNPVGLLKQ